MLNEFKKALWVGMLVLGAGAALRPAVGAQEAESLRKVTKKVAPLYPQLAARSRLAGTVKLMALVTPEGTVKSVRTIGGNPVLATAAEDAVKQWRYEASKKASNEPVEVRFVGPQ